MTARQLPTDHSFMYFETSIPAGLTITEYRRARPARRRGFRRLLTPRR